MSERVVSCVVSVAVEMFSGGIAGQISLSSVESCPVESLTDASTRVRLALIGLPGSMTWAIGGLGSGLLSAAEEMDPREEEPVGFGVHVTDVGVPATWSRLVAIGVMQFAPDFSRRPGKFGIAVRRGSFEGKGGLVST